MKCLIAQKHFAQFKHGNTKTEMIELMLPDLFEVLILIISVMEFSMFDCIQELIFVLILYKTLANIADQEQTALWEQSDLSLHCLLKTLLSEYFELIQQ